MKSSGMARLGGDMELRFLPDGSPVGQVSLAVRLGIKDKATGEYKTQWISASMFGSRAEILAPMLLKGALHCFHLRDVRIEEFTGKDGESRVSMKATIEDVELAGKQSSDSQHAQQQQSKPHGGTTSKHGSGNGYDDFDSDLPF